MDVLSSQITLLNNKGGIWINIKTVVKLPFGVAFKPQLSHSRAVGHPTAHEQTKSFLPQTPVYFLFSGEQQFPKDGNPENALSAIFHKNGVCQEFYITQYKP
jgi:hypothetical protein